jgi:hypothetical protein
MTTALAHIKRRPQLNLAKETTCFGEMWQAGGETGSSRQNL